MLKGILGFRKFWIFLLIIGLVLFLLSSNAGRKSSWNPFEQALVEITAPIQKVITRAVNFVGGIWNDYFYLVNVREENRVLKEAIDRLRMQNLRYKEIVAAQERLEALLKVRQAIELPVLAAQVVGRDPTGWFKSVIIDRGRSDGVKVDMPVVNASGVVGRIVSVSLNYSKVLLIIDQNSSVDCLVERSRDRGMVKGRSSEICKMEYVVKSSDVIKGDSIITSSLGGVYPKGLPVGRVSSLNVLPDKLFKEIQVRPAVDFSKLEEVLIVLKEIISTSEQTAGK